MSARTVKPDGKSIQALRLAKGWRAEDLAEKAECSVRTLSSIEAGKNCFVYTLRKIAEALEVKPIDITHIEPEKNVLIDLSTPFKDFDETVEAIKLLARIRELLEGNDDGN